MANPNNFEKAILAAAVDAWKFQHKFKDVDDKMKKLFKKRGKFGLVLKYIFQEKDWYPYGFALFRC